MLGAEIPTWLAALGLIVAPLTAVLTLLITNRTAARAFQRESSERAKVRADELRAETWKADRSGKIELYRRLIQSARLLLDIDQPMVEVVQHQQEAAATGNPAPRHHSLADFDEWNRLFAEAELLAPNIVPAATTVRTHYYDTLDVRVGHMAHDHVGPGAAKAQQWYQKSHEVVAGLIKACADDIASFTERG